VVRLLTVPQAAEKLGRHPEMLRIWLRDGRIRGEKFGEGKGGVWMIREREIARFLKNEPGRRSR
jgi:excisionase family DNA binding protein